MGLALVLVLGAVLVGCAGGTGPGDGAGVVHVVRPGETLWRISKRYGVSVDDVTRANHIRDVTTVPTGARLWIPDPRRPRGDGAVPARYHPPESAAPRERSRAELQRALGLDFAWPVQARLSSQYGRRRGRPHEGIDLAARKGTPVRASESGRVIYSGSNLGAYGRVVIVKHLGQYSTVYAHNRRNRVSKGQFVEKGDVVAEVGASGNATGPHLHFEIRDGQRPVDPLRYLP